ncbi:N-acetyltransferase [Thalassococcus sp. S3]|uniref:GNAT family N-acetyltransferase n=1 Tax=Thalassococcus sp. S3 TaxID=2017482 RepID=UPI00102407BE|nr:GNAT family N-acetyltransferase [Thalassococcus sp. S3]QBF32423.1 N-acetyltransferase [Thalassococcus sp. S3]
MPAQTPPRIEAGLRPGHRQQAARGYWAAFSRKLQYPLGPEERGVAFIARVLDPSHAISAVSETGAFLGVAGFKTVQGAFVGGEFGDLSAVYGPFGAAWRALLVSVLEREVAPDTLLMDGLFVEEAGRGLGVGTALLSAVEAHAGSAGLTQVRLDVVDTNPRARSLYERRGFQETATKSIWPLSGLFGFEVATTMIKKIGTHA